MNLERAVDTIEYKIATESDSFERGNAIKMDITPAWPSASALSDVLQRKYPRITITLEEQANDVLRLIIKNTGT